MSPDVVTEGALADFFVGGGADMIIHPANAPCTLAAAAAAAAVVVAAAAAAAAASEYEGAVFPTSGSVKKDQPPPMPG